jgi:putative ABC transport system permease protein
LEDMEAIKKGCPDCWKVGVQSVTFRKVKYKNKAISSLAVVGATANITEISDREVYEGRTFSEFEVDHNRRVCFVGWQIRESLFPNEDPMGKDIKIGNHRFRIIGVAAKKGNFLGENQDDYVLIPISTYGKLFAGRMYVTIFVKARDFLSMQDAMDQSRVILRARRGVDYDKDDDFSILTSESVMDFFRQFTNMALMVMGGIASISLVVGGIVIMNIMLVSVTERTREIGIRKALGARRRNILWQFLVEAVTLALVGGMVGIIMGALVAKLIAVASPLPASVELWSVVLALFVSSSVGIFFGIFPAMKAARLNPIEALRYE